MDKLKEYRNIFGAPNEGPHAIRVYNIALIDLFGTFLVALIISYFSTKEKTYYNLTKNFLINSVILLLLGIFFHRIFSVNTTLNMLIFGQV